MAADKIFRIRDVDSGQFLAFDDYSHTVTMPDGRKVDFIEYDPANRFQADFSTRAPGYTQAQVHVAGALSNFAIDYGTQEGMAVADILAPPLLVQKASDTYHTFSKNDRFRRANSLMVDNDSPIPEVGPTKSSSTYTTAPYGASTFISAGIEANADSIVQVRMRGMRRIMNVMTMDREARVSEAMRNTTTFAGYTVTLTTSNYWDDGAASDPRKDLITGMETMLMPCTHMGLSEKSWHRFVHNAQVAKYGLYLGAGVNETPGALMDRLGFGNVIPVIGRMRAESTTAGTTTIGFVWDDDVVLAHVPPAAGSEPEAVPTARTFRWLSGGMSRESGGYRIREWDVPDRGQDGGRKIAVVCNEVVTVTGADAGYVIENVW